MENKWNAFMNENISLPPLQSGLLNFYTFAIKDVFSIEGYKSSAGNPDWLRTHQPAEKHAAVIEQLLNSGAELYGTTHTDELMYSLDGKNTHYGTPVNPKAPECIPGGSSSGSAVAVASGLVDFAIGTDTGGSIRIPSSYCGIFGFRPTHGAVSTEGCIPLAKSFDTVGWMANDAETLQLIGDVLLDDKKTGEGTFSKLYYPIEAWGLLDENIRTAFSSLLTSLEEKFNNVEWLSISNQGLQEWAEVFRIIQGTEIWEEHGEWVQQVKPDLGPGISERFQTASTLKSDAERCIEIQKKIRSFLYTLLDEDGLIVIPTAHNIAPMLNSNSNSLDQNRSKNMQLTCIAGLGGLPQVTLPLASIDNKPVGLSLIANHGQDKQLLKWASVFMQSLL